MSYIHSGKLIPVKPFMPASGNNLAPFLAGHQFQCVHIKYHTAFSRYKVYFTFVAGVITVPFMTERGIKTTFAEQLHYSKDHYQHQMHHLKETG